VLALPDFSELAPLFAWPVEGQLSSAFGRRRMGWHRGIDIKADLGTIVTAAAGGTVVASGYQTRYGRVVKIEHANGFMTVYAHNDDNLVEAGDRVMTGQIIAAVGRTGRATAHHLHFEIRQAGLAYNPLYLLPLPPRTMLIEETAEEDHDDADE
jgi:murein DD-endopeptidase MepM/ murein hydrolase activator NlpD